MSLNLKKGKKPGLGRKNVNGILNRVLVVEYRNCEFPNRLQHKYISLCRLMADVEQVKCSHKLLF